MREIMLINPGKKKASKKKASNKKNTVKKTGKQKKAGPMAKSKKKRKSYKKNPSARRLTTRALGGLNVTKAATDSFKMLGGMLAAQWAAKRFADGGGANDPNWDIKNYAFGIGGAFAAGMLGNMIKKGTGQEIFKGGLALMMYKAVVNEVAPKNEWLQTQLGEFDELDPAYFEDYEQDDYLLPEYEEEYDIEDDDNYLLGEEGTYDPAYSVDLDMAGDIEDVNYLGDDFEPVGSLGGDLEPVGSLGEDPYAEAFLSN